MIYVWKTGHHINEKVTEALHAGLRDSIIKDTSLRFNYFQSPRKIPAIAYGILRGTADVFMHNREFGLDFIEVDRGYIRPRHFDGFYRISKNALQAKYQPHSFPDDRFRYLDVELSSHFSKKGHILICPPTDFIQSFYGLRPGDWEVHVTQTLKSNTDRYIKVRQKGDAIPLENDLTDCYCVVTFNSNVAIDATIRGIPVCTGAYSVCGAWNKISLQDIIDDKVEAPTEEKIEDLLRFVTYQQFTLDEIKRGIPWEIISI